MRRGILFKGSLAIVLVLLSAGLVYGYEIYFQSRDLSGDESGSARLDREGSRVGSSSFTPESKPDTNELLASTGVRVDDRKDDTFIEVHRASTDNTYLNSTYLDMPGANGQPEAILIVTQNWNPGGGRGVYNEHEIGVWYNSEMELWSIYNQDREPMPIGASFNVLVFDG